MSRTSRLLDPVQSSWFPLQALGLKSASQLGVPAWWAPCQNSGYSIGKRSPDAGEEGPDRYDAHPTRELKSKRSPEASDFGDVSGESGPLSLAETCT